MAEADSVDPAEPEETDSSSGQETVATLAELCLNTFQQGLKLSASHHPRYLALIEDQLARFSIWTSGNGVFAKARASMDHRLREAPDVQLAVCSLLEALDDSLQTCLSSLELVGNRHEDSNAFDVQNDDFKSDVQSVAKEISLLYRLTNTIRRASKERQNAKAAKSYHIRDDEGNIIEPLLQELYSHYILGRFPSIENNLRSRLAASMVLRRKMVLYRRSRYGTNPIRADKNVSQPKIDFPQTHTQPTDEDEPSEELVDGIEAVATAAPQSSIQSQAPSATTLAIEDYKKTSTPSVISATKTVALANHEELPFPPIPNGRVKDRYKKLMQIRWDEFEKDMMPELRGLELTYAIDRNLKSTSRALQRPVIRKSLRSCLDFGLEDSPSPGRQEALRKVFSSFASYQPDGSAWQSTELYATLSQKIETVSSSLRLDWIECNEAIGELTCPYCLYAIPSLSVAEDKKWKAHVTKDLDAYVCLFDECDKPDKLFSHSSDWLSHMREHTLRWRCSSKAHSPLTFLSEAQYLHHVRQDHPRSLTEPQLRALAQRNARPTVPMFDFCPICGTDEAAHNLEDHIVGHLRFLALKSLPPHEEDGSGSSDGESGSAAASGPASRSTIKNDPERHVNVVFEDRGDISTWGSTNSEQASPSIYEPWGGYRGYIKSQNSSSMKMGADPTNKIPHLAAMYREEDENRFLWHNDPSRYFVEDTIFKQIPTKNRRNFEWGFVTYRTDEPTEALQHDSIIQGFADHSSKTLSTQTGGPVQSEHPGEFERRKEPRVFCSQCSEHPSGFRSDLELQRHINAKHVTEVTKFVCRDPASAGLESKIQPKVPLKGCKDCDSGKQYMAYYNAAAHLRRAHFVPKLSRGKIGRAKEKRAGKASGGWPPMNDLALWYEKITVMREDVAVSSTDEAESLSDEFGNMDIEAEDFEPEPNLPEASTSGLSDGENPEPFSESRPIDPLPPTFWPEFLGNTSNSLQPDDLVNSSSGFGIQKPFSERKSRSRHEKEQEIEDEQYKQRLRDRMSNPRTIPSSNGRRHRILYEDSTRPIDSSGRKSSHLDASGDREVVFCHNCENEWYRDQHGLECPRCESDLIEIVNLENDPRDVWNTQADSGTLDADSTEEFRFNFPHDSRQDRHPTAVTLGSTDDAVTKSTSLETASIPESTQISDVADRLARALVGSKEVNTHTLIQDLPLFTHDQMMSLRTKYKSLVKTGPERKGVNIAKHIRARLKDNPLMMKASYSVALGKWESEAYWCSIDHHSPEIRRELLIESLMGRTNEDVRRIKEAFLDKKYDNSLKKCIDSELAENKFKRALLLVLEERQMDESDSSGQTLPIDKEQAARDVEDIRSAIQSERGGEWRLIEIVLRGSAMYLRELLEVYQKQYSSHLTRDILKKCENLVGEFLAHILNGVINRPTRDALLLHSAITSLRFGRTVSRENELRPELLISRLVRYHWDREHMGAVSNEYSSRYGSSLGEAVKETTSGDWGEFCVRLCTAHLKGKIHVDSLT
ncbi:unnamed protein product [Clonostachys rosea]|uniref:C2H2-type domain-containing protein n=1 Tax=Bionectria ochroleuca TaxID=29856 RepID=A0ABY6UNR4_BIOOC|nr:unnamed protein product [Clonostachys rosea]